MKRLLSNLTMLLGISRRPQTAYERGRAAFPRGHNPYEPGTVAQAQWQQGYNDREEEAALSQQW